MNQSFIEKKIQEFKKAFYPNFVYSEEVIDVDGRLTISIEQLLRKSLESLNQHWMSCIPKEKEIFNPDEVGVSGTHAISSNQNHGYNTCLRDLRWNLEAKGLTETALKCQDCGMVKPDVEDKTCSYAEEINGTEVHVTICGDCYHERSMDI